MKYLRLEIFAFAAFLLISATPYNGTQVQSIPAFDEPTEDIQILDDGKTIKTFKNLVEEVKGKTVYIDIWATWCGPCKREMAYKEPLKAFADENNVDLLFLSIDKPHTASKWRNYIKTNKIAGKHIRATPELRDQIVRMFRKGESFSIPRYLIIDANGKLVEKDALRPSRGKHLYKQIEKYAAAQ